MGRSHSFIYEKHNIKIALPRKSEIPSDEENKNLFSKGNSRVYYNSWKTIDNKKYPTAYFIDNVDVFLDVPNEISLPDELINHHPNAYDIISPIKQKKIDLLIQKYNRHSIKAFDLWIRTLRWKSDNFSIGRTEIKGFKTGWGPYLVESDNLKHLWKGDLTLTLKRYKALTSKQWNAVGRTLKSCIGPPIYFDLFYDAQNNFNNNDLSRFVIDLSMSCETLFRLVVSKKIPSMLKKEIKKHILNTRINNYWQKFFPEILRKEDLDTYRNIKSNIEKLFQVRNGILHHANVYNLNTTNCEEFVKSTHILLNIGIKYL